MSAFKDPVRVEINLTRDRSAARVTVDGHDVTRGVTGVSFSAVAGGLNHLTLTMVPEFTLTADALVTFEQPGKKDE